MLQGVLIEEAVELLFQLTGDFGGTSGARAIEEPPDALRGKAMHPFPQGRIRKLECLGNVLDTLSFHNIAYRLGTAKDTGFLRLSQAGVSCGQRMIREVQFEGPHGGGSIIKYYKNTTIPRTSRADMLIGTTLFRLKFFRSCW